MSVNMWVAFHLLRFDLGTCHWFLLFRLLFDFQFFSHTMSGFDIRAIYAFSWLWDSDHCFLILRGLKYRRRFGTTCLYNYWSIVFLLEVSSFFNFSHNYWPIWVFNFLNLYISRKPFLSSRFSKLVAYV